MKATFRLCALCMAICVLLCACASGQDVSGKAQQQENSQQSAVLQKQETQQEPAKEPGDTEPPKEETPPQSGKPENPPETSENPEKPSSSQTPGEPQAPKTPQVTLSIGCGTLVDNLDQLDEGKAELVPQDGVILAETALELTEGETVFDVLKRAVKDAGIHMEHSNTPLYASAYIEGIANLYEFDCGPLSGWMYRVNGEFPNYGCSKYELKDGDVIEWLYTCDLGADIGGEEAYSSQHE